MTTDLSRLPQLLSDLYQTVKALEEIAPGRRFTPDGHLVGSIGDAVAAYSYDLVLSKSSTKRHDAKAIDGRGVQIKLMQGNVVALSNDCDHLLVLQLDRKRGFVEVYNGAGIHVWALIGHKAQPGRQRLISVAQLRALADQAGTPLPLLRQFPATLPKTLEAVGAKFIEEDEVEAGGAAAEGLGFAGAQIREARRLLGWSGYRLNGLANLPHGTVEGYEKTGRIRPSLNQAPPKERLAAIRSALEAGGVEFTDGDAPGVRLRQAKE